MSKNLLIVDGNSILNRAFYGIRPLSTREGLPTNAVYGFVTILKKHLERLSPDYMACAFDMKAPTFRHRYYDGYKANRKPMPEDLALQLPYAKEAAAALGFRVVECEGFEADDIIGTVCSLGDEAGDVCSFALTGDRDSLQLLSDRTSVILVKTKEDVVFTPKNFFEEYGVTPRQYIDVKALMGDSSDNIPGVRGIGEKSAFKLIAECGSLEAVYEKLDALSVGKSAKEKLAAGKEDAFLSRYLATIVKDAPVGALSDFLSAGADGRRLTELFTKLEFTALLKRFDFSEDSEMSRAAFEAPPAKEVCAEELFKIIEAFDASSALNDGGCVCAEYLDGELFVSDGERLFVCRQMTDGELERFFENRQIICHDYKGLLRRLKERGVSAECAFDTMLAGYLLSPGEGVYPIEKLVGAYLGSSFENPDAAGTAYAAYRLREPMLDKLRSMDMERLLFEIEIPLAGVLCDMEKVGMKLDCGGIRAYSLELKQVRDALAESIFAAAGHEFNINSPRQLGTVLFDELGLPVQKKKKSGYSTDAEVLASLRPYHEIIDLILHYRELNKLISTYCDVLPELADGGGRVHTTFNQTGTATGRLSSNDPNLQNVPVRGQPGREIRKYFIAEEGHVLIDADYSQIELRVLAEISGDEAMREAFLSGEDIHTSTAAAVFGISPLMVDAELRRRAKAVNFGIVYGIGAFSLSKDLGISRKQASQYIDSYLATYPSVDKYLKNTVARAKETGYTSTLFGRRRPIPELSSSNRNVRAFGERVAMNSPIQGTAADIIKIAMINTARSLEKSGLDARLVMQVHDELIVEAAEKDAAAASEILKREMENVLHGAVPMLVDLSTGKSWYEAK